MTPRPGPRPAHRTATQRIPTHRTARIPTHRTAQHLEPRP